MRRKGLDQLLPQPQEVVVPATHNVQSFVKLDAGCLETEIENTDYGILHALDGLLYTRVR